MQKLRSIHLYLGCIFAPMLLFFAISGIWQTLHIPSRILQRLSTIHTSHALKAGGNLNSALMTIFVLVMAASFIFSTILGVVMAFKYGRSRRAALYCLAVGVVVPLVLILLAILR
jgi:hypothetical protein